MTNIKISELRSIKSKINNISDSEAMSVTGGLVDLPDITINTQVATAVPLSGNLVAGAVFPGGELSVNQTSVNIAAILQDIS